MGNKGKKMETPGNNQKEILDQKPYNRKEV